MAAAAAETNLKRTGRHEQGSIQKIVKLGLVGDGTVGKTTLLLTYTCQAFIQDYVPTVFDNFSVIEDVDGVRVNAILWDTAGQEDFVSRFVRTSHPLTSPCNRFPPSVVSPNSFDNVKSKWLPELKQYAPNTPFILIGTKVDLLKDADTLQQLKDMGEQPVTNSQAKRLAKDSGAELYLQATGREVDSVNKVFNDCLRWVVNRDNKQLQKDKKKWNKEIKAEEKLEKKMEKLALEGKDKS